MTIGYGTSSLGTEDSLVESTNIPVPSGAASGDIVLAVCSLHRAGTTLSNFAWPAGFTNITLDADDSEHKMRVGWKRLTGSDAGNYTPTWTNAHYVQGGAIRITGGLAAGDPIEAVDSGYTTDGGIPDTQVTINTLAFLAHFVGTSFDMTATPGTNFTEVQDDGKVCKINYRIPGATGTYSNTDGTTSGGGNNWAALVAVKPAAVVPNEGYSTDKTITWAGSATGTLLTVPGNFTATVNGGHEIDLDWDPVPGALGYHVYRDGALVHSTTDTSWNNTGLDVSTEYCYRVVAFE